MAVDRLLLCCSSHFTPPSLRSWRVPRRALLASQILCGPCPRAPGKASVGRLLPNRESVIGRSACHAAHGKQKRTSVSSVGPRDSRTN
jgi:hypothetical protein